MLLHGAIIFGDLIEGRCNAYFHRANLRSAKLAFFRHCQVRIIWRLDLILVLPIAFRTSAVANRTAAPASVTAGISGPDVPSVTSTRRFQRGVSASAQRRR